MTPRLQDSVVLISGGAQGVGRAASRRFAAEGAAVVIVDIDDCGAELARELANAGSRARFIQTDVADIGAVAAAGATAIREFEHIDVLFNHAGSIVVKPFLETTERDWDWLMDVNVKSMFFMTQAILPNMLSRNKGVIINMSSVSAVLATPMESLYCITKAAVQQFTRAIAVEYRDRGIRCNAVCPGFINTGHGQRELDRLAKLGVDVSETALRNLQGRIGTPEEVGDAVFLLALDDARFVNGAMLYVDNGLTAST